VKSLKLILSDLSYFAPAWVFASLNILTGTWVLYLPFIKNKFTLNDAEIGMALFSLAFGLFVSIPFVPYINRKIGVGKSTKIGVLLYALSFNLPLAASGYWSLCMSLFLTGIFSGFTDVSMNALVAIIEKRKAKQFMSAAHGFFSLGGFIGAGVGSIIMMLMANPTGHMLGISMFILLSNLYLSKHYEQIEEVIPAKAKGGNKFQHLRPLYGLSIVAFIIAFNEGSVEHWSNLFLFEIVQMSESQAGLGFIAFSLCMTIGRFLGDGISQKKGSINIILGGSGIAFIGYLAILATHQAVSVLGFGILGLGLSVIIPELLRLAGNIAEVPASIGISIVSGIGFAGFLCGPVLLGLIAEWTSLIGSFVFLSFLMVLALGMTFFNIKSARKV
jgi:MFS family permease